MSSTSVRETVAPAGVSAPDLTPEIHSTLQALANVETRYSAERDSLGQWPGPRAVKERLLAQLERRHARERQPLVQHLADLQREMTSANIFAGIRLH
jgi:hypothetical protein